MHDGSSPYQSPRPPSCHEQFKTPDPHFASTLTVMSQSVIASYLGPIEAGVIVIAALLGVVTVQTYYYYTNYPNDSLKLKTLAGRFLYEASMHFLTNTSSPGRCDMVLPVLPTVSRIKC